MKYNPGDQIESYRLLRECGSGAYGTVFLAENVVSGQKYALKIIPENNLFSQRELRGIVQYMQICPRSGLMQIYHAGRCGDSFYYVMDAADNLNSEPEYLPDTLENRIKRNGRIPPQSLLKIAKQTEERLRFLHRSGFLHRDIKPGNILFLNGEAVPGDIGLLTGKPGSTLAGTPGFLSPQAAAGTRPFAPEDDFYALGKTLYCALTGYPPEKYPAFPSDLSLKECKEVIDLYNRWCAGHCEPEPGRRSGKKIWIIAGTAAAAICLLAVSSLVFRHIPNSPSSQPRTQTQPFGPVRKQFCSVKEALQSVEKMFTAHVPPPGFIELRPKLEAERQRLRAERNRRSREAYHGPVSQKELEQAVKAPDLAGREAEYYVRIKHKDEAAAAFDREQENNPVLNYFRTADYIAEELNLFRALAPMQGMESTDFSADRKKFEDACERLAKLERELMQNRSFK
ncbi:MAG: protein kinase [Lentisphaeria bacterium]|nr:protein kinase [Lentisphaeria bacterium]